MLYNFITTISSASFFDKVFKATLRFQIFVHFYFLCVIDS